MFDDARLIGVFELGNPWMLAWLAAAGIPLALHLLHRRRQQEIPWAAMELLLQAIRQNSRTVRIEQWLLLLLRTAALVLLAIALARPILRGTSSAAAANTQPPKLWVLVLDASYSMQAISQRQTLWDLARQRASTLVGQAAAGDAFALIELAEPSRAVIGQPAFESSRVIEELRRRKCTDGGGDLSSCLEVIRQTIDDARQSAPQHQDVHIVFFTDLGRDSWQTATAGADRRALQELASRHALRIESLALQSPANLAVTALETDTAVVLRGRSLRATATVQNFGPRDAERLPVQFQSEGKTHHTAFIDCPAGSSRTVTTDIFPPTTHYWSIGAAIPDDRLAVDNRRDLIVSVRPQVRVVTLAEASAAAPAKLINLSLAPQAQAAPAQSASAQSPQFQSPIRAETWNATELQTRSLTEIDALVLVDPAELAAGALFKIRNFVEAGGAILLLPGPHARAGAWNRNDESLGALSGFDLRQPSPAGDWRIDPLGYASPIAKPFANFQDAGLLTTPIFRYWQIVPRDDVPLQVDLGFTNGDPWLLRRQLGSGWVASLLSTPQSGGPLTGGPNDPSAEELWNAMATWPSFVPVMQKIVETIIGGAEQAMNVEVGQPLAGFLTRQTQPRELVIRRPDNSTSRLTVPPASEGIRQEWIYAATDEAGVYRVHGDAADAEDHWSFEHPYAVNIVPTQSSLESVSLSALPLGGQASPLQPYRPAVGDAANSARSDQLARWCLVGLLAVLGCESVLAWSLGRRLA